MKRTALTFPLNGTPAIARLDSPTYEIFIDALKEQAKSQKLEFFHGVVPGTSGKEIFVTGAKYPPFGLAKIVRQIFKKARQRAVLHG